MVLKTREQVRLVHLYHSTEPDKTKVAADFDAAYELVEEFFSENVTAQFYSMASGGAYKLADPKDDDKTAVIKTTDLHETQL